eukprot:g5199.t1
MISGACLKCFTADIDIEDAEYGLYALIVPQLVYSFIGQSRQLMVGPVAMLSLLLRAGLEGGVDPWPSNSSRTPKH